MTDESDPVPPAPDSPVDTRGDTTGDASVDAPIDAPVEVDLDAVERDLTAVETALKRLDEGTYWTDEITGEDLPEDLLVADPTARRA